MAVGIWTCVDHSYMEQLIGTNLYISAAYILIATGVVVVLISFLGCYGAIKEIKCMLLTVSAFSLFNSYEKIIIEFFFLHYFVVFYSYVRNLCDHVGGRYFGICVPSQCKPNYANSYVRFSSRVWK